MTRRGGSSRGSGPRAPKPWGGGAGGGAAGGGPFRGGPLPDVAGDVGEAVAVGREPPDRRGSLEAARAQVLPGKVAVPAVGHDAAPRLGVVAPGVGGLVETATRGVLPLGLGGQPAAGPGG